MTFNLDNTIYKMAWKKTKKTTNIFSNSKFKSFFIKLENKKFSSEKYQYSVTLIKE